MTLKHLGCILETCFLSSVSIVLNLNKRRWRLRELIRHIDLTPRVTPQVIFRYGIQFSRGNFTTRVSWVFSRRMKMRVKPPRLSTRVKLAPHWGLAISRSPDFWSQEWSKNKVTGIILRIRPVWENNMLSLHLLLLKTRFNVLTISFVSTSPTISTIPAIQRYRYCGNIYIFSYNNSAV